MWRQLVDGDGARAAPRPSRAGAKGEDAGIPAEPPQGALPRPDGSRVQLHGESTLVRWTCRGNGSWRKPELFPLDQDQLKAFHEQVRRHEEEMEKERLRKEEEEREAQEAARRKRAEKLAAAPAAVAAQKAAAAAAAAGNAAETVEPSRLAELLALREPPEDSSPQQDGSFQLALEDGATIRWTKRPDGTWRKPEHRRAGWVGDLEQEKYVPPTVRLLEDAGVNSTTRAWLRDPDYDRDLPLRPGPVVTDGYPAKAKAQPPFKMSAEDWPAVNEANGTNGKAEPNGKTTAEPKAAASRWTAKVGPPADGKGKRGATNGRKKDEVSAKVDMELLPALTRLCVANRWQ